MGVVEDVKEMKAKEDTEWVEMEEGGVDVSWIDEGNDMEVDSAGEVDVGSKDGIDDLATQMISIQPE